MKSTLPSGHPKTRAVRWLTCVALIGLAGISQAQTIYRAVGPDGKVSFSDQPPSSSTKITTTEANGKPLEIGGPVLPTALRQVVGKYPVTLYTATNCSPCASGRALLNRRGVPFTEKTVTTIDDSQALERISGETSLPFLTIGGQQIRGYSDAEWTQFLDAAGYPKTSVLPPNYRNLPASPLVVVQKPAAPAKAEEAQRERPPGRPSTAPADNTSNPAGIKF